jgi:hypothetical protein
MISVSKWLGAFASWLTEVEEAYITTGSDAHFCFIIGQFDQVTRMFEKINMPEHFLSFIK